MLAIAGHVAGWPAARGGSRAITDALVAVHREHGGELELGRRVESLDQLPEARAYLLDVSPPELLAIARDRLPHGYAARLSRYRFGPGVFKMDFALRGPIPWRDPVSNRAATVHLAGDLQAIADSEAAVHRGAVTEHPFVIVVQPSRFDSTRAPDGMHTAWAYCHVPNGSDRDASATIEAQIERAAPGFGDLVMARAARSPAILEAYDSNYVGGDINGGIADLRQLFFRPMARFDPYATPAPDVFLCSASTPPGGGVHGMCGYWAARSALTRVFGRDLTGAANVA
jgi:phytoene dehydrogenase-like protein